MTAPTRRPLHVRTAPAEPTAPAAGARLLAVERADPDALLATPEQADVEPGREGRRRLGTGPDRDRASE